MVQFSLVLIVSFLGATVLLITLILFLRRQVKNFKRIISDIIKRMQRISIQGEKTCKEIKELKDKLNDEEQPYRDLTDAYSIALKVYEVVSLDAPFPSFMFEICSLFVKICNSMNGLHKRVFEGELLSEMLIYSEFIKRIDTINNSAFRLFGNEIGSAIVLENKANINEAKVKMSRIVIDKKENKKQERIVKIAEVCLNKYYKYAHQTIENKKPEFLGTKDFKVIERKTNNISITNINGNSNTNSQDIKKSNIN